MNTYYHSPESLGFLNFGKKKREREQAAVNQLTKEVNTVNIRIERKLAELQQLAGQEKALVQQIGSLQQMGLGDPASLITAGVSIAGSLIGKIGSRLRAIKAQKGQLSTMLANLKGEERKIDKAIADTKAGIKQKQAISFRLQAQLQARQQQQQLQQTRQKEVQKAGITTNTVVGIGTGIAMLALLAIGARAMRRQEGRKEVKSKKK